MSAFTDTVLQAGGRVMVMNGQPLLFEIDGVILADRIPPAMTYEQACYFFSMYGNVCSSLDMLLKVRPTPEQLDEACRIALSKGQHIKRVCIARNIIILHWYSYTDITWEQIQ